MATRNSDAGLSPIPQRRSRDVLPEYIFDFNTLKNRYLFTPKSHDYPGRFLSVQRLVTCKAACGLLAANAFVRHQKYEQTAS
jgi:hypothetical protein